VPFGSVIADKAMAGNIPITYEAFADRNYNDDLSLVSRSNSNAIISDPKTVFEHVYRMIIQQKVRTINGVELPIKAQTFCIHGDNPKAIKLVKYLRKKLISSGLKTQ
jgi:UPF0271 protein